MQYESLLNSRPLHTVINDYSYIIDVDVVMKS